MSIGGKLRQAYFNVAYNQVYDFTTGQLSRYYKLQQTCISKLELKDNDRVLCVGIGTGNEISHIVRANRDVNIVGVDYSNSALCKAYTKASVLGKEIELLIMDAQHLKFAAGSFDKVLCIHVMDFIEDKRKATNEILRVLKDGGQFVVTYPSGKEDLKLAVNLLKDNIGSKVDAGKHRAWASFVSFVQLVIGTVYLPLLLRPNKRVCSRDELKKVLVGSLTGYFQIEEDPTYHDFIVYGRK